MKKLSVFFVITILGIVLWALPAGAEKIRLTDDQMDNVAAGTNGLTWVNLHGGFDDCVGNDAGACGSGGAGLKIFRDSSKLIHLGGGVGGCVWGFSEVCAGGGGGLNIYTNGMVMFGGNFGFGNMANTIKQGP
jgi:hypothetical protein